MDEATVMQDAAERLHRKQAQDAGLARRRAARRPAPVGEKPDLFARDVRCSGCPDGIVPVIPRALVGDPRALCPACSAAAGKRRKAPDHEQRERFERRLRRVNLEHQAEVLRALGITAARADPELRPQGRWERAASAVLGFVKQKPGGVLMLSGPPRQGKTTAAYWAAWTTHGRVLERKDWMKLVAWGDTSEREWLLDHPGVVVLDEVCTVAGGKTPDGPVGISIVNDLVRGRHARHRSTICTTNAPFDVFMDLYGTVGEAIWARSTGDLFGPGAGWVDCGSDR